MIYRRQLIRRTVILLCLLRITLSSSPAEIDPISGSTTGNFRYPYRLFEPVTANSENRVPLIVFLHGIGEKGTDNKKQVQSHIQPLINTTQEDLDYQAYLVAPQSSSGWFSGQSVVDLVEHLKADYWIDPDRVYVTGLSAGGKGTWVSLAAGPDVFAAGIPLSAVKDEGSAPVIAESGAAVWLFHGTSDSTVGSGQSQDMVDLLVANGGSPRYTFRSGWGHCCWSNIYADKADWTDTYSGGVPEDTTVGLYPWLFSQRLSASRPAVGPLLRDRTVYIDLGANSTEGFDGSNRYWNNAGASATQTGVKILHLRDNTGEKTMAGLQVVEAFNGANPYGADADDIYPNTVQNDVWYVGSPAGHAEALSETGDLRLTGLREGGRYRLSLFGSRTGNDGGRGRLTRFTVHGVPQDYDPEDNTDRIAEFADVTADSGGNITIQVTVSPAGTARYGYLGALELTAINGPVVNGFVHTMVKRGFRPGTPGSGPLDDPQSLGRSNLEMYLTGDWDRPTPSGQGLAMRPEFGAGFTPCLELPLADPLPEGVVIFERRATLSPASTWNEIGRYTASTNTAAGCEVLPATTDLPRRLRLTDVATTTAYYRARFLQE